MAFNRKQHTPEGLPTFELTDLGWLGTLPAEAGTFLGQVIQVEIGASDRRDEKPHPQGLRELREILKVLPACLAQLEQALRDATRDDPELWPRQFDPVIHTDGGSEELEEGGWTLTIEAIDHEGGSWDATFQGSQLIDLSPAES